MLGKKIYKKKFLLRLLEDSNFLNNQNYIISSVEKRNLGREFLKELIWGFYEKYFKISTLYNRLLRKKNKSFKDLFLLLLFMFLYLLPIVWWIVVFIVFSIIYSGNILLKNHIVLLLVILIILFPILIRLMFFFWLFLILQKKHKKLINYLFTKSHFYRWYLWRFHIFKVKNRSWILLIFNGIWLYFKKNKEEVLILLFISPILYSYYPILLWFLFIIVGLYYLVTKLLLLDIYSSYILVYRVYPVYHKKFDNTFLRFKVGWFLIGNIFYLIKDNFDKI